MKATHLSAGGLFLLGCFTVTPQAAMLPVAGNPRPAPTSAIEARVGANTLTGAAPSTASAYRLYAPRLWLDAGAGVRIHELFALRLEGSVSPEWEAVRLNGRSRVDPPQPAYSLTVAPALTLPLDDGRTMVAVGIDISGIVYGEERRYCQTVDPALGEEGSWCHTQTDTEATMMVGGTLSMSRWVDQLRLTATLGARNQPTSEFAFDTAVHFPGFVAVAVGAELLWQVTDEFHAEVSGEWVYVNAPYTLYPSVGISFGYSFGERTALLPRREP